MPTSVSNRILSSTKHAPALSFTHILGGVVAFPLFYGLEIWWVSGYTSDLATITFALLLIPTGLFARFYCRRVWKLLTHLEVRVTSWLKLGAVGRVARARDDLVQCIDHMRDRYRVEVLGWTTFPPRRPVSLLMAFGVLLFVAPIPHCFAGPR